MGFGREPFGTVLTRAIAITAIAGAAGLVQSMFDEPIALTRRNTAGPVDAGGPEAIPGLPDDAAAAGEIPTEPQIETGVETDPEDGHRC